MSSIDDIKRAIAGKLFSGICPPDALGFWSITGIYGMTDEAIQSYRLERLRDIVSYANDATVFWHRIFSSAGIDARLMTLKSFERIPILTKANLKHTADEILANDTRRHSATVITTSGSSGVPLTIYADKIFLGKRIMIHRHYLHAILKLIDADSFANLRTRQHTMVMGHPVNWATNDLTAVVGWLAQNVRAASGPLFHVMNFAKRLNEGNLRLNLDFVVSGAEFLSETDRKYLENTFNCPVYNLYSNAEVGLIAFECQKRCGFHVNTANMYVEIVDEYGVPVQEGKIGRILVSAFDNKIMPIIRYDTADLGQWIEGACVCGLKTPRLTFEGRASYMIKLPNGREHYLTYLTKPLHKKFSNVIEKFQFIQESRELLVLKIIPTAKYTDRHGIAIKKALLGRLKRTRMTDDVGAFDIKIEKTDTIENFPSGKARLFVSAL